MLLILFEQAMPFFLTCMRRSILIYLVCLIQSVTAQELFVFTEPASNMATSSAGIRLNNYFMHETNTAVTNYHLVPELMYGVSRKLMLHAEAFLSNRSGGGLDFEGAGFYGKYRFFSVDEVHSHFRIAAFGRFSFNNSGIHQPSIDLIGHNSGYETGFIFTKLANKLALSSSLSCLHAFNNGSNTFGQRNALRNAIGYSFSAGKLLLPKDYTSYRQTNLNAMVELLGQVNTGSGLGYLDLAPSLQLIINSVARIDLGQRIPLAKKLFRTAPGGIFVRLEYNLFNLF